MISKWIKVSTVSWTLAKVKDDIALEIVESGLGRHETIYHKKLCGLGTPLDTVHWSFLGCN